MGQQSTPPVAIKAVARLPMGLLALNSSQVASMAAEPMYPCLRGYLRKRGKLHTAFKQRSFALADRVLTYSKRTLFGKDQIRGTIRLDAVSSVRPATERTLELVTPTRTWHLQAATDAEYEEWVRAICHSVSFDVVDRFYRRMLQLAEVSDAALNAVQLVVLPMYTVGETIEHIFECYKCKLGRVPLHPYKLNDYVLLVDGHDYLADWSQYLDGHPHVRACCTTKKTLCLTVVSASDVHGDVGPSCVGWF
ncbi:hypothetical protein SPRG_03712 [Saprolegnia parasitica CBS 223.65]|uniref:PH domain-containing protein n=1 Tax=Saprolegnia parasitica (strain CBS 223.65) TaxID=695850 RepID=A0A067CYC0_SAPPC|nr:hypothetical protein SPRG_03712 [Saprolegnia parasitica CBS 223.65]KDO31792.1 hypothetical protein SPRG_03712 [Saprolegnia parasitica CBS 223.65]|eukprot:XP_012197672.1 hypothetical protein SPRG_03712 [Saprolegnia parasitica CBS 223.65]